MLRDAGSADPAVAPRDAEPTTRRPRDRRSRDGLGRRMARSTGDRQLGASRPPSNRTTSSWPSATSAVRGGRRRRAARRRPRWPSSPTPRPTPGAAWSCCCRRRRRAPDPPAGAIVLEAPADDPDGVFARTVGRFAAALDAGRTRRDGPRLGRGAGGWERDARRLTEPRSGRRAGADQLRAVVADVVDERSRPATISSASSGAGRSRPWSSPTSVGSGSSQSAQSAGLEDDRHPVVERGDRLVRGRRHDRERAPDRVGHRVAPAGPQPGQGQRRAVAATDEERPADRPVALPFVEPVGRDDAAAPAEAVGEGRDSWRPSRPGR